MIIRVRLRDGRRQEKEGRGRGRRWEKKGVLKGEGKGDETRE